ncbi:MAG: ergothioneine biosynthesis protein EgtB [Leptospirales bacterium]
MSSKEKILQHYKNTRLKTHEICSPLEPDDYNMQAMYDGSPPKWNIGHCTWAFEAFALSACVPNYKPYNEKFAYCFNSYYETVGERIQRHNRHLLSRPTLDEVYAYRKFVDEQVEEYLTTSVKKVSNLDDFMMRLEIAINHEQQHQELFFTDLKHIFFMSPLQPAYAEKKDVLSISTEYRPAKFNEFEPVLTDIGHTGDGFSYDNELGRHKVYLNPFSMMNRLVTNGEFIEFVEDGGYSDFRWWLSDAWATVQKEDWKQPLYWTKVDKDWYEFTLHGMKKINHSAPVCHVSFFEADAYAKYKEARLPTEFEWEHVANTQLQEIESGHFMDNNYIQPIVAKPESDACAEFFGNVWELTQSSYLPYPNFVTPPGALAEYNGKFMNDQRVLRGGSCATPQNHIRSTYRNFWQSDKRWQFSGFRLTKDL